ncbi:MAG: VCBS repeat-containing protein [Cyclobacteriaceae bacterium]|nr:VCBS repeat-containing protein [Cyclobacteriaceae bacterium]
MIKRFFVGAILIFNFFSCEDKVENNTLFREILPRESSIYFVNELLENDQFNIVEYLYYYNGGGVAIGDLNGDGLPEIYFTSNQGANKLYLNKGNFQFEDITESAHVAGSGNWTTGVTMADVNADGLLDIYVCGVGNYKSFDGFNQLFINNGDLTFTEQAANYGLDFKGFSTQAGFFDFDLDGDLDMYLLNHSVHTQRSFGQVSLRNQRDNLAGDRLYKNQLAETGKTFFVDVTNEAGIFSSQIGYGLGLAFSDLNRDNYPDIYVSNDFHENDYLYINQKDGTFRLETAESFPHTSRFSMGNDVADINNDGWSDIVTLDMLPREESVIKTSAGEDTYEVYKFKLQFGYGKQVSRNALQLNRGTVDSGRLIFSDIAQVAGVEATDWSWSPLAVDFDGDGWKDLFISNGIVKRPNDLDYINYLDSDSSGNRDSKALISKMPDGSVSNFIYKNNRNLTFSDETVSWGLWNLGFSNGAAYGDLDNDGDPDLVINRINEPALLYRNESSPGKFLKISLKDGVTKGNPSGIGARISVSYGDVTQVQEVQANRGWCSSSDTRLTFARLDTLNSAKIQVVWPGGDVTELDSKSKHVVIERQADAINQNQRVEKAPLMRQVNLFSVKHEEDDFNAFNRESLIPHMLSTQGPPVVVADCNGDGIDDLFIGGGKGQAGALLLQNRSGKFSGKIIPDFIKHKAAEDTDAAFVDVDADGDVDLVVVSGGQEELDNRTLLMPRLYLNDGAGNFTYSEEAFSNIYLHASCVRPYDFDGDGDIDLFIGASVMPFLYGMSPVSYLLENDGKGKFTPVVDWLGRSEFDNPTRVRPGMVKDAKWIYINQDKLPDLVLAGEWMPITVLIQQPDRKFKNATNEFALAETNGWWNALEVADFDNDGDLDLIAGNLGLNSRIKVSQDKPLWMYVGDFDSNGGSDHILVYYNGENNYPFASRDQLVKQIPSLKKKFPDYKAYRDVKLEDIITPVQKGNSALMRVTELRSVFLRNNGGSFSVEPLPVEAQHFPVYGILADDVNRDGNVDLLLVGNLEATQPDFGAYDAGIGLLLLGDGKGGFDTIEPMVSGFVVKGEGRGVVRVKSPGSNGADYVVSRNSNTVLTFKRSD